MIIPKKITIGKRTYKIKDNKIFVDIFNSNVVGYINYTKNTISIKKQKDSRETESVLFHEIAHGILKELEYNHPKASVFRNDEEFVQEMGLMLRKSFLELLSKQKYQGNIYK